MKKSGVRGRGSLRGSLGRRLIHQVLRGGSHGLRDESHADAAERCDVEDKAGTVPFLKNQQNMAKVSARGEKSNQWDWKSPFFIAYYDDIVLYKPKKKPNVESKIRKHCATML